MRRHLLMVLAAGLLLAADAPKDDGAKKELKAFTGTWQAVSVERDGKEAPKEEVAKMKLIVKGNRYTFHSGGQTISGTHRLDPAKDPKQIDAMRSKGPDAGETLKGIYTLEGDTFKVCFAAAGKDRPTEFSTTSGGGHRLLVMKRSKP